LIALTEGQQIFGKKSQKQIYVEQGILKEGLESPAAHDDLKAQINEVSKKVTLEHIKAFYKRLVEKRPLASVGVNDYTLLRDGDKSTDEEISIGCCGKIRSGRIYALFRS